MKGWPIYLENQLLIRAIVNEILGEHNVDKQISDSRGDVGPLCRV
jgi:hypothetical protein